IMPGFIHGFIHDSKHGTSAISNHPVPLLQMKSLSRGLNQQRKGGLFVALTFERVWTIAFLAGGARMGSQIPFRDLRESMRAPSCKRICGVASKYLFARFC
ncbi:hypothetical protein, partial [Sinorhizobium meliloti]|uniref:hypothetical protein n=1 Tax=Rhizobium meliloti TaxID=382 RepID=UPI003F5CCC26